MLKWLRKIFIGCEHKWNTFHTVKVYPWYSNGDDGSLPVRFEYHLRCEKCGNIKIVKGNM